MVDAKPNGNFEFNCKLDDRCNRKYLDSKLAEEIEHLNKETDQETQQPITNNQLPTTNYQQPITNNHNTNNIRK